MSAAEGQSVAAMTVKTLQSLRSEENFWEEFTRLLVNLRWNIPHYHAKEGHMHRRYGYGSSDRDHPGNVQDINRRIFFEELLRPENLWYSNSI